MFRERGAYGKLAVRQGTGLDMAILKSSRRERVETVSDSKNLKRSA